MDKDMQLMDELLGGMEKFLEKSRGTRLPLNIYKSNGDINYAAVMKLISDPSYEQYRQANPDVFQDAKVNMGIRSGQTLLKAGYHIAKLGFAMKQIRTAKNSKVDAPSFPKRERSQILQRVTEEAWRRSTEGLSHQQVSQLREQANISYETTKNQIIDTSSGQSSDIQNRLAGLSRLRDRSMQEIMAMDEQARSRNQSNLNQVAGMNMREDQAIASHNRDRFNRRDMPLYLQNTEANNRLQRAGITNLFGATGSIIDEIGGMIGGFESDLPGTIRDNSVYAVDDTAHPLNGVFSNAGADEGIIGNIERLGRGLNGFKDVVNKSFGAVPPAQEGLSSFGDTQKQAHVQGMTGLQQQDQNQNFWPFQYPRQ